MMMAHITISLAVTKQMPRNINGVDHRVEAGAWMHTLWTAQAAALIDMKNAPNCPDTARFGGFSSRPALIYIVHIYTLWKLRCHRYGLHFSIFS